MKYETMLETLGTTKQDIKVMQRQKIRRAKTRKAKQAYHAKQSRKGKV